MTFDLSPELDALTAEARRLASTLIAPAAASIDATGRIPDELHDAAVRVVDWDRSALGAVLAIEELAAASGSAAASVALGADAAGDGLAGLRGVAPVATPTDRQHLGLAAVCVGLGRHAIAEAVGRLGQQGDRPSGEPGEAPHWVLADAATELEAARLLVRAAAAGDGPGGGAAALVFAGAAALAAVEAALRIVGADAFRPGSAMERVGRDVRAALLVLGTEDEARRRAADALLG